jgi:hypothetical protein
MLAYNRLLLYVLRALTSIISTRIQPCNRSQIWHRAISLGLQKEWPSIQRKESADRSLRTREIVGVGLKICTWCRGCNLYAAVQSREQDGTLWYLCLHSSWRRHFAFSPTSEFQVSKKRVNELLPWHKFGVHNVCRNPEHHIYPVAVLLELQGPQASCI